MPQTMKLFEPRAFNRARGQFYTLDDGTAITGRQVDAHERVKS